MTCPHDCFCHTEGERGIISDGTGTELDPFMPQPDTGRTIPRTVSTAVALPIEAAEEDGQLAWVNDTRTMYEFNGVTLLWEPIGPEWRQTFPSDVAIASAAGTYDYTTESITIDAGSWFLKANGVIEGEMDAPGDPGAGATAYEEFGITVVLTDVGGSLEIYDTTKEGFDTWTFHTAAGDIFSPTRQFAEGFDLQEIATVPVGETRTVKLAATRQAFTTTNDFSLVHLDILAIRVANHQFTT